MEHYEDKLRFRHFVYGTIAIVLLIAGEAIVEGIIYLLGL